jgi:hypothetical protein
LGERLEDRGNAGWLIEEHHARIRGQPKHSRRPG